MADLRPDDLTGAEAVIFDLDGTLADSGADIAAAADHARRRAGLVPLPAAEILRHVGDGTRKLIERVLAHDPGSGRTDLPVSAAAVEASLADFGDFYREHLLDHTVLYPGIAELLRRLAPRRLLVATNKPRAFTLAVLAGLGLADRFDRVVCGDDVPARKPDPAHLRACLEGTGIAPRQAVMVGDSPHDVLAAHGAGLPAVAVTWGLTPRARLVAARPAVLVDDATALGRVLGVPA
jgi:phosphoglycolate phosphatase